MMVAEALRRAQTQLESAHIDSARLDTQLLLAQIMEVDREYLLAHSDQSLTPAETTQFNKLIIQRANHVPLVHLTGQREFYGLRLDITPDVLTPRVETEQIVEWAVKYARRDSKLVDIGTGSGAIAIAIAKSRPDLNVWATEVSAEALACAKRNARKHNVKISFIESDLFETVKGKFSSVVTNLPYLRNDADLMPEVRYEPAVALFGGVDGLDLYRRFLSQLPAHLASGGFFLTECDPWQQDELITAAAKYKFSPIERGYFIMVFENNN